MYFVIFIYDIILQIVIVELPPTPSKFHYIFNLKDLSRIFAGMCLIHPNFFKHPKELVRVWRNEFVRVICDRLISENVCMMFHIAKRKKKKYYLNNTV